VQIVRIRRGHSAYAEYGNCRASGPYAPRVVAFETANANRGSTTAPEPLRLDACPRRARPGNRSWRFFRLC
jgi:hypothetical protein